MFRSRLSWEPTASAALATARQEAGAKVRHQRLTSSIAPPNLDCPEGYESSGNWWRRPGARAGVETGAVSPCDEGILCARKWRHRARCGVLARGCQKP